MKSLCLGVALVCGIGISGTARAEAVDLPPVDCPTNLGNCTANDVVTTIVSAEPVIPGDTCTGPEDSIELPAAELVTESQARLVDALSLRIDGAFPGSVRGRIYAAIDDADRTLVAGAFDARDCR